jgi:site-specific DNA recombinase
VTQIAIYTRISLDRSGEQTSSARQEADCRRYAEMRGWGVAEVYEDVEVLPFSGVRRPNSNGCWRTSNPASWTASWSGSWTGWCAGRRDFLRVHDVLQGRSSSILASFNEQFDTSTAIGKFVVQMLVLIAELESATISLRVRNAE